VRTDVSHNELLVAAGRFEIGRGRMGTYVHDLDFVPEKIDENESLLFVGREVTLAGLLREFLGDRAAKVTGPITITITAGSS
jgi:hypothetical protein